MPVATMIGTCVPSYWLSQSERHGDHDSTSYGDHDSTSHGDPDRISQLLINNFIVDRSLQKGDTNLNLT